MKKYKINVWDNWYYHMKSQLFDKKSDALKFAKEQKENDRYCHCELYYEDPNHPMKSLGFVAG